MFKSIILTVVFLTLSVVVLFNLFEEQAISQFGQTTQEKQLEEQQTAEVEKLQEEVLLWQEQLADKPDYRDAYLKLAVLNWKLRRHFEAWKFLQAALALDPNNKAALELEKEFNTGV